MREKRRGRRGFIQGSAALRKQAQRVGSGGAGRT